MDFIINTKLALDYDFKHSFSYKLLFYIVNHINVIDKSIELSKKKLNVDYNVSLYTIGQSIEELISYKIITPFSYKKGFYKVNGKVFIKNY